MAAKKTSKSKAPSKKTAVKPQVNKSQFIRDNPALSVKDLIAKAKKAGFPLTPAFIYTLRSEARRKQGKSKAKPSKSGTLITVGSPRTSASAEKQFADLILRLGTERATQIFDATKAKVEKSIG